MVKRIGQPRPSAHLSIVGLSSLTLRRYRLSVSRFFAWLSSCGIAMPTTHELVDFYLSEYLNFLFNSNKPETWATDAVSGMTRLVPSMRGRLKVSWSYISNWRKTVQRSRALPLSPDVVLAMASLSLLNGKPRFAAAILLSFSCLFRPSELVSVSRSSCLSFSQHSLVFVLSPYSRSKSASREGQPQSVTVVDPYLVRLIRETWLDTSAPSRLLDMTPTAASALLGDLARTLGFSHPKLTLHSLRRGGATWHFNSFHSLDETTQRGRWQHRASARLYIDAASYDLARASFQESTLTAIHAASRLFPTFASHWRTYHHNCDRITITSSLSLFLFF